MDKYLKDKSIGFGSFGTVWQVKSKQNNVSYVLKEIDLNAMSPEEKKRALTEVTVLAKCKHTNIIRYKDAVIESNIGRLSIIMEYADGGDLNSSIKKQRGVPFKENCVISWFIQICLALQYIHYRKILHRDLKTQNIFLTSDKIIKVGDFGIARVLQSTDDLATTSIGTPFYLSPEICLRKPYNYKSDMWALGCVLFEMSALEHPFKADNLIHLVSMILEGRRKTFPNWCSPTIKEIVKDLLNTDPVNRPSTDEVLAYPSLQKHLSKYVATKQAVPYLIGSRIPTCVGLFRHKPEICGKHSSSTSTLIPKTDQLRSTSPNQEDSSDRSRSSSLVDTETLQTSKYNLKTPESTKSTDTKPKSPRFLDSSPNKACLNKTYFIPVKLSNLKFTKKASIVDDEVFDTNSIDCGYQSEEPNLCNSDKKANNPSNLIAHSGEVAIKKCKICTKNFEPGVADADDFSKNELVSPIVEIKSVSGYNVCQHDQCYKCVLDMLWKNRIRDSLNPTEYSRLKKKLSLVFEGNLFHKVYQSLWFDWEGNGNGESRASIQRVLKTLTYEQVQHLPLMMQLIQLDLQMKSLERK